MTSFEARPRPGEGADDVDTFPFHQVAYAQGLPHLGDVVVAAELGVPVLRRAIPGSPWCDGVLPPPYVAPTAATVAGLARALPDLVSIVGVISPSSPVRWDEVPAVVAAKDHYVLDPTHPLVLSRRSRRHLRAGEGRWSFERAAGGEVAGRAAAMHARVAAARGFAGTSVAFPAVHFEQLARARWAAFFTVRDHEGELGGVACGVRWADELHLLHLAVSPEGLRSCASYVLMHGVTAWCAQSGRRLFLGGVPRTGTEGLARFKARWTNDQLRSHLVRVVVRPGEYAALGPAPTEMGGHFPAYRAPG